MNEDGSLDPEYTLVVKAESDWEALWALDSARIAVSRFEVRPVPGRNERLLSVTFAFGDGSEWYHDVDVFRLPVEQRLDEWLHRGRDDWPEYPRFPMGRLLSWTRGGAR